MNRIEPCPGQQTVCSGASRYLLFGVLALCLGCPSGARERQGCEVAACHGRAGTDNGIEDAHPKIVLLCTNCHGGDATTKDQDRAHVPPAPQFIADLVGAGRTIKTLAVGDLDRIDPAYLRFINPGDYRVAKQSCGSSSPVVDGAGCHQSLVYSAARSTMATFVGHFNVPRFQAGLQGREAVVGSIAIDDPRRPDPPPAGTVASLVQAAPPADGAPRDEIGTAMDNYLPKNCTHCHQWSYGRNDARGNYRSSGCTACHMLYSDDGISLSSDPSAVLEKPPRAERHILTSAIGENQCEHPRGHVELA